MNGGNSGWIGRFIESYYYDLVQQSFPIGVEIGSKTSSLGFHGAQEHGLSLNIEGQAASGFYSVLSGLGGEAPSFIPNSHYGEELQYIIDNDQRQQQYILKQFQMHLIMDQTIHHMTIRIYQIS